MTSDPIKIRKRVDGLLSEGTGIFANSYWPDFEQEIADSGGI